MTTAPGTSGKVVHFEIPMDEPARGTQFYREAFGWALERFGPMEYWTTPAGTGAGIGGALTRRSTDSPAVTFYLAVDDVDAALASVERAGGRALTRRAPIPGVGWTALFEDSEGNRLGLFEEDPAAGLPSGIDATP